MTQRDDHDPPWQCQLCQGDGWIRLTHAHNPRLCTAQPDTAQCLCQAVQPCECSTGRQRTDVFHRIIESNDRLLNPYRTTRTPRPEELL